MNRSAPRTPFYDTGSMNNQNNSTMKFPLIDKKLLPQILSKQGVEVSPTFFDAPKREEIRNFLDDILSLVFGPHVVFRDMKSVQHLLDVNYSRNKRNPFHPVYQQQGVHPPAIDECLPDRGHRQLQGMAIRQTLRCFRKFGSLFGIPDIRARDVSRPTPERLIQFGSAVVDYIRFQEQTLSEELEQWNNVADKGEQAKNRRIERDEFREAARRTYEHASQRAQERSVLDHALDQKESQLCILHDDFKNVITRNNEAEMKHSEFEEKDQHRDSKMNELKFEIKETKDQIVDSPRRIVETLKSMTAKAEVEQNAGKCEELLQPLNQQHRNIVKDLSKRSEKAKIYTEEKKKVLEENEEKMKASEEQKKQSSFSEKQLGEQLAREKNLRKNLEVTQDELVIARNETDELRQQFENEVESKRSEKSKQREERGQIEEGIEESYKAMEEFNHVNGEIESRLQEGNEKEEKLMREIAMGNREKEELVEKRLYEVVQKEERRLCDENHPLHNFALKIVNDDVARHFIEENGLLATMTEDDSKELLRKRKAISLSKPSTPIRSTYHDTPQPHDDVRTNKPPNSVGRIKAIQTPSRDTNRSPVTKSSTSSTREIRVLQRGVERLTLNDHDVAEEDQKRPPRWEQHRVGNDPQQQTSSIPSHSKQSNSDLRSIDYRCQNAQSASSSFSVYDTTGLSNTMPIQRTPSTPDRKAWLTPTNLNNRSLDISLLRNRAENASATAHQRARNQLSSPSSLPFGRSQDPLRSPHNRIKQSTAQEYHDRPVSHSPYYPKSATGAYITNERLEVSNSRKNHYERSRSPHSKSSKSPIRESKVNQRSEERHNRSTLRNATLRNDENEHPHEATSSRSEVTETQGASPLLHLGKFQKVEQNGTKNRKIEKGKSSFRVSEDGSRFFEQEHSSSHPWMRNANSNSRRKLYDSRGPSMIR